MSAKALILSRDEKLVQAFTRAFAGISIVTDSDQQVGNTLRLLSKNKYDAVVVDCDHSADAADVLLAIRSARSNKKAIVFAVLQGHLMRKGATDSGANFIVEKPLTQDKVLRSVRAAHGMIVAERRRYSRIPVKGTIFLQETAEIHENTGQLINVSDTGAALSLRPKGSKKDTAVKVRFLLPGSTNMIAGNAEVAWSKDNGEVGVRFTQLSNAARNELREWLQHHWKLQEMPRSMGRS
jgi:response regulator RpfG family c-di-GMP phosphodiesterase